MEQEKTKSDIPFMGIFIAVCACVVVYTTATKKAYSEGYQNGKDSQKLSDQIDNLFTTTKNIPTHTLEELFPNSTKDNLENYKKAVNTATKATDLLVRFSDLRDEENSIRDSLTAISAKPWQTAIDSLLSNWDVLTSGLPDSARTKMYAILQKPVFLDPLYDVRPTKEIEEKTKGGIGIVLAAYKDSTAHGMTKIFTDGASHISIYDAYNQICFGSNDTWYGRAALVLHEAAHIAGYSHSAEDQRWFLVIDKAMTDFTLSRMPASVLRTSIDSDEEVVFTGKETLSFRNIYTYEVRIPTYVEELRFKIYYIQELCNRYGEYMAYKILYAQECIKIS